MYITEIIYTLPVYCRQRRERLYSLLRSLKCRTIAIVIDDDSLRGQFLLVFAIGLRPLRLGTAT